jgi:hypothetical protein
MQFTALLKSKKITPEQLFMLSVLAVNGGNYLYNLILGRLLGPSEFADAAVLITFLLVLSFAAMTFQLVTAKFSVLFEHEVFSSFIARIYKHAFSIGLIIGFIIVLIQQVFSPVLITPTLAYPVSIKIENFIIVFLTIIAFSKTEV